MNSVVSVLSGWEGITQCMYIPSNENPYGAVYQLAADVTESSQLIFRLMFDTARLEKDGIEPEHLINTLCGVIDSLPFSGWDRNEGAALEGYTEEIIKISLRMMVSPAALVAFLESVAFVIPGLYQMAWRMQPIYEFEKVNEEDLGI